MNYSVEWSLLGNSLLLAGATAVLALVLGFAYALTAAASSRAGRALLLGLAVLVLALPSFLVTNCWIDLLGTNGALRSWLPLHIFSLGGAVWVLALMLWPIPAFAVWAAWGKLEAVHFEADSLVRGVRLMRLLLWPAAKSLALAAAAVVFALALGNFAVPAILQVKVFPAHAWVQFNTNLDPVAALELSWPVILAPLALLLLVRQPRFPWPRESDAGFAVALRRQLGWPCMIGALTISVVTIFFAAVAPLAQLLASPRTWDEFIPAISASVPALTNSLVYAGSAAALALALGLVLARVRWLGWLWLFFLVPGILLGIGAASFANHPAIDWFSRTALIVVALLVLRHVALTRALTRTGWLAVDSLLIDSARLDGARGVRLFRTVVLPQIAPHAAAAAYLVYLLCLWDVETTLLVLPPGGETLAVRVFNLLHYGHNAHVNALCILLLLLALAPLLVFGLWRSVTGRETK